MTAAVVHLSDEVTIGLRPIMDEDKSYILKTWKETMRQAPSMRWARNGEIYRALNARCDRLLEEHGATVACNPEHEQQLLGFAVIDRQKKILHYVYVLKPFRRCGLAKALVASAGLTEPFRVTHWSQDCEALQERFSLRFLPSLL